MFTIVLGDGQTIKAPELAEPESTRESFASAYGDGSHYTLTFPDTHGLQIVHRITRFKERPFLLLELSVVNRGEAPITIVEINPLVIGAGGIDLGGETHLTSLPITARGSYVTYDPAAKPLFAYLGDSAGRTGLALGLLPQSRGRGGVELEQQGATWQGRVFNVFEPGYRLAPGERLSADTVWISYGIPVFDEVNLYYAWTHSTRPGHEADRPLPKGWVTVEAGRGADDLAGIAQAAQAAGFRSALLPAGFENRPGNAARQLRAANFVAGITLDPLRFEGGQPEWSLAAGGSAWLNPGHEAARALIVERVQALHKDGFGFFVVAESAVPEAALESFGLSRAAADGLALQAVAAAAGALPVFPAATATLDANDARLLSDQQLLAQFGVYKSPFGPVRLSFSGGALSQGTLDALKSWPGPIEVLGAPPQGARGALRPVFQQGP